MSQSINPQIGGMKMTTYKIIRFYADSKHPDDRKVIKTGLTLEEAQAHCNDEKTHEPGVWFDGYTAERI